MFCAYTRPRSGERLQDNWSSGLCSVIYFTLIHIKTIIKHDGQCTQQEICL